MPEYKSSTGEAAGKGGPPSPFANELIDVLLRGLGTARDNLGSGDPVARGKVCIGWYVDTDHSCALWYSNPQQQQQ